jgi:hypothetical protein
MAKFKVEVTLIARSTYEVDVEADSEGQAEDEAAKLGREKSSDDFQVAEVADYEFDTEQLTWDCDECRTEITQDEYQKNDGMCGDCKVEYDREGADGH